MTASTSATSTICARSVSRMRISGVPAVAQTVHRVDGVEGAVHRLELAADALHVRGDGRVVDHDVRVAHQRFAILDVPGIASERVHEPELGEREIDRRAAPARLETLHVELERPALDHFFARRRLAREISAT